MRIGMVTDFGDAERGIRRHFTARSFGRPSKNAHISDHCGRRPGWPASLVGAQQYYAGENCQFELHDCNCSIRWTIGFVFARRSGLLVVFAMNHFMSKHLRCFIGLALLVAISACNKMSAGTNMLAGVPLQKDLMIPLQAEMQN